MWKFKNKAEWTYIENISKAKVLGSTEDGKVILEVKDEDKHEQLWGKGVPNKRGYFTLKVKIENGKFMTAISSSILEIKSKSEIDT